MSRYIRRFILVLLVFVCYCTSAYAESLDFDNETLEEQVDSCIPRSATRGMPVGEYTNIFFNGSTTICMYTDGTVKVYGYMPTEVKKEIESWTNIVDIAEGGDHWLGLKSDGTVVAYGTNEIGECDVEDWTDIVDITAGKYHSVGLKSDGTVVATGNNRNGQCNVDNWKDVVEVKAIDWEDFTVGLKSDGTVVTTGESNYINFSEARSWNDIVDIAVDYDVILGLQSDGLIVADRDKAITNQSSLDDWFGIVDIEIVSGVLWGFKENGGINWNVFFNDEQKQVSTWEDISAICFSRTSGIGIKEDGTVLKWGDNEYGQLDIDGNNATVTYETLGPGSKGEAVVKLQERLNINGYWVGTADGDYGNKTKTAVEQFQQANGLSVTGIADPETQKILFKDDITNITTIVASGTYTQQECEEIAIAYMKEHLNPYLKNPSSLQINDVTASKVENSQYMFLFTISSMNSFGGYDTDFYGCYVDYTTGQVMDAGLI